MIRRRTHQPRSARRRPLLAVIGPLLLLAFIVVAALVLRPTPVETDTAVSGRLIASEHVVDLQRVPFDRQVEARYTLVNTGGTEVRLIGKPQVKTLEGC